MQRALAATSGTAFDDEALLEQVQREAFRFFVEQSHPETGLVRDSTQPGSPCSIAAVGFALTSYPIGVRRGWLSRADALARSLLVVRSLRDADMSGGAASSGHRGFFFHFLDPASGRRAWRSELSTIDTALLVAGVLCAASFFDDDSLDAQELRSAAETIYCRIEWNWAQNGGGALALGWKPERGFLRHRWIGYSEALLLYVLALGSPTHPASRESYQAWLSGYRCKRIYGIECVYAGPLFVHQFPHVWIDFRGIRDTFMAARGIDYFENSRRATHIHREYAIRNPRRWAGYGAECWGLSAGPGPGPDASRVVAGRKRRFYGYCARGAPFGPDDGTVSPWAMIASLPFAPELVLPAIRHLVSRSGSDGLSLALSASHNPSYAVGADGLAWRSPWEVGIDQGPVVAMIENHRDGFVWSLMRQCAPVVAGLRRAGFRGGWLDA